MAQDSYVLNTETTPCGLQIDKQFYFFSELKSAMGTKSEHVPLEVQMTNENKQQGI